MAVVMLVVDDTGSGGGGLCSWLSARWWWLTRKGGGGGECMCVSGVSVSAGEGSEGLPHACCGGGQHIRGWRWRGDCQRKRVAAGRRHSGGTGGGHRARVRAGIVIVMPHQHACMQAIVVVGGGGNTGGGHRVRAEGRGHRRCACWW